MYEIVFGAKPRWRESGTPELLPPVRDRNLTEEEQLVLDACRHLERVERGLAVRLGHLAGVDEEVDDLGEASTAALGVVDRVVPGR